MNLTDDELISAFLVEHEIRPAMLIQPQNYGEVNKHNLITCFKLEGISIKFPNLIQTEIGFNGILLSKVPIDISDLTSTKLGQILGYPSFMDYEQIHPDIESSCVDVFVYLKNGSKKQLFANCCLNENVEYAKNYLTDFSNKASNVLFVDAYYKNIIERVGIEVNHIIPTKKLIELLMNNQLSEYDKSEILNLLWNLGFEKLCSYEFNYSDPFHKGILMTLLTHYDNNPLDPFFPLQQWGTLDKLSTKQTEKWEDALLKLLIYTGEYLKWHAC